jgi:hypothetical protein
MNRAWPYQTCRQLLPAKHEEMVKQPTVFDILGVPLLLTPDISPMLHLLVEMPHRASGVALPHLNCYRPDPLPHLKCYR